MSTEPAAAVPARSLSSHGEERAGERRAVEAQATRASPGFPHLSLTLSARRAVCRAQTRGGGGEGMLDF